MFKNSKGQTLIEYVLLITLIAVALITAVTFFGQKVKGTYTTIETHIP